MRKKFEGKNRIQMALRQKKIKGQVFKQKNPPCPPPHPPSQISLGASPVLHNRRPKLILEKYHGWGAFIFYKISQFFFCFEREERFGLKKNNNFLMKIHAKMINKNVVSLFEIPQNTKICVFLKK